MLIIAGILTSFGLGFYINTMITKQPDIHIGQPDIDVKNEKGDHLKLGAFSVSLSVRDLKTSKQFYENLGFTAFAGAMENNYLIVKNENSLIGLFQGMFTGNILTFNPGWDENARNLEKFDDVREIQRQLKNKGIKINNEADEQTSGPASFMITDPDGNVIYIDQHR
jgi:predicted enzyme related to lactoylglutathione lyase